MDKSFWIVLAVVIVAGAGLILFSGSDSGSPADNTTVSNILTVKETDHKRGLAGSSVTLIEYADFQCSACAAIFPVVDQIYKEFGDQIEFVTRNFPITSIHPNSMSAHRAAEAASVQDSFWEMHDLLYERQQSWSSATNAASVFEGYASELELNIDKFKEDAVSQTALDHINDDANGGKLVGVQGTPTFFLNGEQLPTPRSLEEFRAVLQAAIDEASSQADTQQ